MAEKTPGAAPHPPDDPAPGHRAAPGASDRPTSRAVMRATVGGASTGRYVKTGHLPVAVRRGEPPTRLCGYSQCENELEYDGNGRPPEYCKDRRWPDGKTCKQLAA